MGTQRFLNPAEATKSRTGAEDGEFGECSADRPCARPRRVRLYPAGKRPGKGSSGVARLHCPQDERGENIFCDFNSHDGCFSGATCMHARVRFKNDPLRWRLQAEPIRRG